MIEALRTTSLIVGVSLITGGAVMFVLSRLFGAGGLFDSYRRDKASEAFFAFIVITGAGFIGLGALA